MYENLPEEELYKYLKLLNDTKQGVYTEIRNRKIIEIKGNRNVSYVKEKSDVTQKTFGIEYETYNQKDLYNMGLKVRTVSKYSEPEPFDLIPTLYWL